MKFPPSQIKHPDRRTLAINPNRVEKNATKGGATEANEGSSKRSRPRPRFYFSYSGIKTAVLRYVETHNMAAAIDSRRRALAAITKPKLEDYLDNCDKQALDLVASFQRAMVGT